MLHIDFITVSKVSSMKSVKISGKSTKHKVFMYTLSTCAWCKMAKSYFCERNIESEYVDVDRCSPQEYELVRQDITSKGGTMSFPTIIIDDKILITGFHKDRIEEVLELR